MLVRTLCFFTTKCFLLLNSSRSLHEGKAAVNNVCLTDNPANLMELNWKQRGRKSHECRQGKSCVLIYIYNIKLLFLSPHQNTLKVIQPSKVFHKNCLCKKRVFSYWHKSISRRHSNAFNWVIEADSNMLMLTCWVEDDIFLADIWTDDRGWFPKVISIYVFI